MTERVLDAGFHREARIVAGAGLLMTAAVGLAALLIGSAYSSRHPFFLDPCAYAYHNARLHERLPEEGRLAVAMDELAHNPRHPLRTVPVVLLAPGALASRMGHLVTAIPMFLAFVLLLGHSALLRSGSLAWALASMAVACGLPGLTHPRLGLPAYWLDLPAACLVACAVLCLLNAYDGGGRRWFAMFAVFVSLATLGRFIAAAYAFVVCAPVLVAVLVRRWKAKEPVLVPLAIVAGLVVLLAGPFIAAHFRANTSFYSTYGYALNQGIGASVGFVTEHVVGFIRAPGLVLLAGLAALLAWRFRSALRMTPGSVGLLAWIALAVPLFLVFGLRASLGPHAVSYAMPMLVIAVAMLAPPPGNEGSRADLKRIAIAAAVAFAGLGIVHGIKWGDYAATPAEKRVAQKRSNLEIAERLVRQPAKTVWCAFVDEYGWNPAMEAFYKHGVLPLSADPDCFTIHASAWRGSDPGLSDDAIAERVWATTRNEVDLAVVLEDPAAPAAWLDNSTSKTVARVIAARVAKDPAWERVFSVTTPGYGRLAGYRNSATKGRAYDALLKGKAVPAP